MKNISAASELRNVEVGNLLRKDDKFRVIRHFFDNYYLCVDFRVKTKSPISGLYNILILWAPKFPHFEERNHSVMSGINGDFNEDGYEIRDLEYSSLNQNIRNITHLKGNKNYWPCMTLSLQTLEETYDDVIDTMYSESK